MLVLRDQKTDIFSLFRKVILYSGHRGRCSKLIKREAGSSLELLLTG